jgi:hypothetical protein
LRGWRAIARGNTRSGSSLTKALGTAAQLWLNLQNDYDLQIAKRDLGKILNRIETVNKRKATQPNGAGARSQQRKDPPLRSSEPWAIDDHEASFALARITLERKVGIIR